MGKGGWGNKTKIEGGDRRGRAPLHFGRSKTQYG